MVRYSRDLSPALLGRRVMVRHRDGGDTRDAVGDLVAWRRGTLTVRTRGGDVEVPEVSIVAGKPVPEPRLVHAAEVTASQVQRISARSWRALDVDWLGGWLLRAGAGFTGRANSALPLGEPGVSITEAVGVVAGWYAERGLTAKFQLPLPDTAALDAALDSLGWAAGDAADMMVADVAAALSTLPERPDLPPVRIDATPSPEWLASYHYRGGTVPAAGVAVLTNHERAGFAVVTSTTGEVQAIARGAVDDDWLGVTAVEVVPAARRLGLARHVMRGLLSWAAGEGARHVHLQVDVHNEAAKALYAAMAFSHHHTYRYRTLPPRPAS